MLQLSTCRKKWPGSRGSMVVATDGRIPVLRQRDAKVDLDYSSTIDLYLKESPKRVAKLGCGPDDLGTCIFLSSCLLSDLY
jgi:hypothetical protein